MSEFPACARCEKTAVVLINGDPACLDHLDETFADHLDPLRDCIDTEEEG